MVKKTAYLIILSSVLSFAQTVNEKDNKLEDKLLNELHIRGGLPNVKYKINKNDSLTIAYFGGSITNQKGWRVKSFNWFKGRFTGSEFKHLNAAIGGTDSQFGAFRLKEHVLKYDPDLIFVEFAVNDSRRSKEEIRRSMEGIVRQIRQHCNTIDICFVYTLKDLMLKTILAGEKPHTVQAMEQIADYYNIPSIWFGPEVARLLKNNQLIMKGNKTSKDGIPVFSPDGVHPYIETGHEIYHKVIKRSLPQFLKKGKVTKWQFPLPLSAHNFEKARMVSPSEVELKGSWESQYDNDISVKFKSFIPEIVRTKTSGDKVVVKFKGTKIGFFDIMGPDAGRIIIYIDEIPKDTISRFDKYCTYHRMNNFLIGDLENTDHTATFEFLGDSFDKELILRQKHDSIGDLTPYQKKYSWYLGKILMVGELKN